MKAFTFLFYTAVTVPLVSFLIYPADPLQMLDDLVGVIAILIISMYAGLVTLIGIWFSTVKKWALLGSSSSVGIFVGLALFPLYFLALFLGVPIILVYMALAGKVHGVALKHIYGINLKT